ncbi:Trimethyllysine dioxygenase [Byssothecium circinans]|uniref:Trimethyllysine dioxygenase n=1 Tax=Byssothecium circinans TaxID=147558 RepID=A0A6A5U4S4_9PLEO|nr:Trimethyllysine dioxygenase [Byssothecium circinans]
MASARAFSRVNSRFAVTSTRLQRPTHLASFQSIRFNSSATETNVQEEDPSPTGKKGKGFTKRLDRALGTERVLPIRRTGSELRKLDIELKNVFRFARSLRSTTKGPYRISTKFGGDNLKHWPHLLDDSLDSGMVGRETKVWVGTEDIPNIWLRDNCQCSTCVHVDTKQRLLDTFSIPQDISIASGSETKDQIHIEWSDGHKSQYSKEFLQLAADNLEKRSVVRQALVDQHFWDSSIAGKPPSVSLKSNHDTTNALLRKIRKYGFCLVTDTPATPEATEQLLRSISFIRETHYGGFYDFTADLASKDTAYTNIALEAHTDTTYFSDPAGLQAFHLLEHSQGEGGESLLVDGFKVARDLLEQDREAYEILATTNVHSHASGNDGISIQPYRGFPVFQHDIATGNLLQVRWNSSDRAAIELPIPEVGKWYDAARKWDALLKKKENEYWEQLKPGTIVIFDNWRVLHGRSAFTGKRRICGGYINRDDWISKFKMAQFGKEEVLGKLASG